MTRQAIGRVVVSMAVVLALMGWSARSSIAEGVPQFVSGDRWCVLGDSITHSGAYHREVELFYLTRYPDRELTVINCGLSGDTAGGALKRLDWDCLDAKPTVVTIMLGMNDIGRDLYEPGKAGESVRKERAKRDSDYETSMRQLVERVRGAGAKVILIKPSIFDDTAATTRPNMPGLGAALASYGDRISKLAEELKCSTVDFTTPLAEINRAEQRSEPEFTIIGADRVHPGSPGHFVMAYSMLRAQGVQTEVSRIEVDVGGMVWSKWCKVDDLQTAPDRVSFTALENALPFPIADGAKPALKWIPFNKELNQQVLMVSGLRAGDYWLKIDDEPIRLYGAAQLGAGVNLADEMATPQMKQALEVRKALQGKWDAVSKLRNIAFGEHTCWPDGKHPIALEEMPERIAARLKAVGTSNPYYANSYKAYMENKPKESEIRRRVETQVAAARAAAQPRRHKFVVERVTEK